MEVNENRARCNCHNCHGALKVIALTVKAQTEEEQNQLAAIEEQLKQGKRLLTGQDVQFALERADWELDYIHFCELLGLRSNKHDQHSMDMWRAFHALVTAAGSFDTNNFGKLIEYGLSLRNVAEGGQLVISGR